MSDSFVLQRFVDAQASIYRQVVEELSRGRKQTHWMWFIFPQIAGLGFSAMAQRFAIGSHAEAVAYLEHDLLGPRLVECTRLVMAASEKPVTDILGSPDDMKFRSVRRRLEAGNLCGSHRRILSRREGPCDFGNSGNEPTPIVIALRRQGTRPQLTCSFRRAQTNRMKIVAARSLRNHHRGPRSPAQGRQVA